MYPYARAAHGVTAFGSNFYVFGGMNQEGALDDMFKFDTGTVTFSTCKYSLHYHYYFRKVCIIIDKIKIII